MKIKSEFDQPVLTYCVAKLSTCCFDRNVSKKNAIEAAKDYNVPVDNVRAETCDKCRKLMQMAED